MVLQHDPTLSLLLAVVLVVYSLVPTKLPGTNSSSVQPDGPKYLAQPIQATVSTLLPLARSTISFFPRMGSVSVVPSLFLGELVERALAVEENTGW